VVDDTRDGGNRNTGFLGQFADIHGQSSSLYASFFIVTYFGMASKLWIKGAGEKEFCICSFFHRQH
jgi:hypothetical protein